MVVTDASRAHPTTYLAPLTYRGAPLDGADHALLGTAEHGVLGRRWIYDGCHDPVLVAQLLAFIQGRAQAQDQNISDTPNHDVTRSYTGDDSPPRTSPPQTTVRAPRCPHPGARSCACTGSCVPTRTARLSSRRGRSATWPVLGRRRTAAPRGDCS